MLQHQTSLSKTEYAPTLLARHAAGVASRVKNAAQRLQLDYWLLMSDCEPDVLLYVDEIARAERSRRLVGER